MTYKRNLREYGRKYEKIAAQYLEKQGYQILEYNFHCRYAEIDIVAQDGDTLVFCEVKYRKGEEASAALAAVDIKKQRRISRAALYYLSRYGYGDIRCRFDVIGITDRETVLVRNAFDYIGV